MNKIAGIGLVGVLMAGAAGCGRMASDSYVADSNLSASASMFELERRIVFYNGITGDYILTIEGRCALLNRQPELSVICKTGLDSYKKHFLGLSDNVTYFVEQLEPAQASVYHYRVIFKPQTILPDIDFRGDSGELTSGGK